MQVDKSPKKEEMPPQHAVSLELMEEAEEDRLEISPVVCGWFAESMAAVPSM